MKKSKPIRAYVWCPECGIRLLISREELDRDTCGNCEARELAEERERDAIEDWAERVGLSNGY